MIELLRLHHADGGVEVLPYPRFSIGLLPIVAKTE